MRRSRSPSAPKRTPSTCAPPSFLCPIGCEIMRDPVTCADGHSYERANIERWLATNNTSPRTGAQLPNNALTPNHALRNAVEEWHNSFLREDALHRADMPSNSLGEGGGGDVRGLEGGGEGATKMVAKVVAKMSPIVVVVSLFTGVLAFFDKSSAGRMPWESTDWSPIGLVLCALTMVVVSLAYLAFKSSAGRMPRERTAWPPMLLCSLVLVVVSLGVAGNRSSSQVPSSAYSGDPTQSFALKDALASCFGLCSESEEAYAKRMVMERAEAAARVEKDRAEAAARAEKERAEAAARAEKERAKAAARAEKERAEAAARAEKALKDALASGLTLKQLRAKGYDVEGLKAVGITCAEAKTAGYTLEEVKRASYTAREANAAGFDIKAGGYTYTEIKWAGLTCAEAKSAGYTLEEVKQAGYTAREAKASGFSMTISYAKQWGLVEGLKEVGFQLEDVMEAGYVLPEILRGGFTKAEAANAGYAVAQLQIALKAARAAGFTIKDAKEAGFTLKDAREAGFKPRECKQAGFTYEEGRAAGFPSFINFHGSCFEGWGGKSPSEIRTPVDPRAPLRLAKPVPPPLTSLLLCAGMGGTLDIDEMVKVVSDNHGTAPPCGDPKYRPLHYGRAGRLYHSRRGAAFQPRCSTEKEGWTHLYYVFH